MSDFLSDGYNLNDYASEGQLFYKPTDKIRFEGALDALCDDDRHVVIVTDDKALAERYYRYFITRIAIRDNIILDTRAPTGADDVLNRFNKILSASTVESARSADGNNVRHVMAMVDTSNMSDHEWTVLGRLLKNFPGANIRMLAFVSESQLDVIDDVLNKLDGQVYRWLLTPPTREYLEALLEMGEQYNYQNETQQMAAAMGYHRPQIPKADLADELDALDAHLESLQNNRPLAAVSNDMTPEPSQVENDFDADLNALLGAIKQSQGVDDNPSPPANDPNTEALSEASAKPPQDKTTKAPSRRLIWATGITGVALILAALFAPWEQPTSVDTQVQITPRTFNTKTETDLTSPQSSTVDTGTKTVVEPDSSVALTNTGVTEAVSEAEQVTELMVDTATEESVPAKNNPLWNDDMARILGAEPVSTANTKEQPSEETELPASTNTDETADSDTQTTGGSDGAPRKETSETVTAMNVGTESTAPDPQIDLGELALQTNPEVSSIDADTPEEQQASASKTKADSPTNGRLIIQQASSTDYFIQLGVYANPTQALLFMDTLPTGTLAFQARLNKSGRTLSTVLSGPYESKAQADAMVTSLLRNSEVWIRTANAVKAELAD